MSVERTIASVLAAAGAEGQLHVVDLDDPAPRSRDRRRRAAGALVGVQGRTSCSPCCAPATPGATCSERVRVGADRTLGSPGLAMLTDPVEISLRDLAALALTVSDVAAADALFDALGGEPALREPLAPLDLRATALHGCCRDLFAAVAGDHERPVSRSTPRDLTRLLSLVWRDEAATPEACAQLRRAAPRPGAASPDRRRVPRAGLADGDQERHAPGPAQRHRRGRARRPPPRRGDQRPHRRGRPAFPRGRRAAGPRRAPRGRRARSRRRTDGEAPPPSPARHRPARPPARRARRPTRPAAPAAPAPAALPRRSVAPDQPKPSARTRAEARAARSSSKRHRRVGEDGAGQGDGHRHADDARREAERARSPGAAPAPVRGAGEPPARRACAAPARDPRRSRPRTAPP